MQKKKNCRRKKNKVTHFKEGRNYLYFLSVPFLSLKEFKTLAYSFELKTFEKQQIQGGLSEPTLFYLKTVHENFPWAYRCSLCTRKRRKSLSPETGNCHWNASVQRKSLKQSSSSTSSVHPKTQKHLTTSLWFTTPFPESFVLLLPQGYIFLV